ncbi:VacJ family lipoprotein [Pseudooceanicola sp. LIPI14-2-Ac024]|uniref:MlaA family lipoprotein n=1 Tax=Pseudooceanicola sp. LIPI14-2-Ac024 TaxID=3344875 RepID=UPI0035D08EEB
MPSPSSLLRPGTVSRILIIAGLTAALAACSGDVDPAPGTINDPYEAVNRRILEGTKRTDTALLRPVSVAYADTVPPAMQESIGSFRTNFSTPGYVVNDVLQMNAEDAAVNTFRFALNSTVGLLGLVDVAAMMGVPARETDFGETLHFWRFAEGAYVQLPVLGPSTERDVAGKVGDLFLNPLGYVIPAPERYAGTASGVLDRVGKRGRYAETVDSVLYGSADPYAQLRNTYLQQRRYQLSGGASGASDAYDDPYGASDAYADPYDDPYAE